MLQNRDTLQVLPSRIVVWSGREVPYPAEKELYFKVYPQGKALWDFTYVRQGASRWRYPGGELVTRPGDVLLVRPGTPKMEYEVATPTGLHQFWAQFIPQAHWLPWLNWPELSRGLMHIRVDHSPDGPHAALRRRIERALFRRAILLAETPSPRWEEFTVTAFEEALLWLDTINPQSIIARRDERLERAIRFMFQNLARPVTLAKLAQVANLSVTMLESLFRKHHNQAPMQFFTQMRLSRAVELLKNPDLPIKEVAVMVGYENSYHFARRFRDWTKLSPTEYRRRLLQTSPARCPRQARRL